MAQLVTVKLVRHDNTPWGFRLQGGKDFGTPLLIQKVNGGSIAERAGLAVGDGLVTVNGYDVFNLKHKEAQDAIVQGGNCLELQVQRGGGSTWKPLVQNVGATPSPLSHLNGTSNGQVKAIVNKQYNTPVGMYSEETIAETLSAQAEVLAGGVIGVNFKKNEKNYDAQKSEVFKMVHEVDAEPKSPEPEQPIEQNGVVIPPPVKGLRHVSAPENKPSSQTHGGSQPLLPGQNICADCERLIVGVFVRIKDKNLHVECFKCATCGTSLKNVGYYTINNKLYCDIHAKMIARQNPPAPNLEPITVSPGGRIPSNVVSNAVSSAMSPKSNPVSSPFQVRTVPMHVSPRPTPTPPQTPNANVLSPKSYNGTAAPLTPPISRNFSQPQTGPNSVSKPFNFSKGAGATKGGTAAGLTAPRRGRGVLNPQNLTPGARVPLCGQCHEHIRGPFITALGKIWCPDHFICVNKDCRRPLQDIGFVEESSGLYCEYCFEKYLAPTCHKCSNKIKGDCLNAIGKHFHPECFKCAFCSKLFGNNPFFLEEGLPYCENDWNELFTTKCFACGFPIEAGDRWVEALNNNYHSPCFNCTMCKKNLEGESFYAKGGRPYCKSHAR